MDVPNPSTSPTFASRTPLRIGAYGLFVRDLELLTTFYVALLGLTVLERNDKTARLGTSGVVLLELIHRPDALPDDPAEAGLYHTAFLMPTRADLARWVLHAVNNRLPISGASDHGVSEAFYLEDPEGNGIEVAGDRPRENWRYERGTIVMPTDPLDVDAIMQGINPETAAYYGAPEGLRIGHVHLRVGNVAKAEEFYLGAVGLELTRRRQGASFMSSGGYHHHVAANIWHSNGADARSANRAGLAWFEFETADTTTLNTTGDHLRAAGAAMTAIPGGYEAADPWGTRLRFVAAE